MNFLFLFLNLSIKSLEIIEECLILLDKEISFKQHYSNLKVGPMTSMGYLEITNKYYKGYAGMFLQHELIKLDNQNEVVWIKCKSNLIAYLKNEVDSINDYMGKEVDVFILDGPVRINHKKFGSIHSLRRRSKAFSQMPISYQHGTAVASKISGKFLGLATESNVIAMNSMDNSQKLNIDLLKANFNKACELSKNKKAIINISAGYYKSRLPILKNCEEAIVVTSAGNSQRNCATTLLTSDQSIVVGSVNPSGDKTYFSNYGSRVDIYVNGYKVLVASGDSKYQLKMLSGTSFSTPYISGFLAVYLSQSKFKPNHQKAKRMLRYLSTLEKQDKDASKYERMWDFQEYIYVFPDRHELNNIKIFGKF